MPLNKATIKKKNQLTHDVIELQLELQNDLQFIAGQYVSIKVMDKPESPCFRAYSIASSPTLLPRLDLCLKVVEGGRATNWLNSLTEGNDLEFLGPIGHFVYKGEKERAIFIATGTGLAPFRGIIEDELAKGNKRQIHLVFGVRHIKDIFYKELFEELAAKHPNFTFDLTLSRPEDDSWSGNQGRVTNLLEKLEIDPENTEAYICGLKDMIESVTSVLHSKGLPETQIHFEKYD